MGMLLVNESALAYTYMITNTVGRKCDVSLSCVSHNVATIIPKDTIFVAIVSTHWFATYRKSTVI